MIKPTKTPKISVIIPLYNVEKYVKDCLDSVVPQTLDDVEIIVVDDASTDRSLEIVQTEYANHPSLTIIKNKKNLGLGETRNVGMRAAHGKYLYFLDSDDMLINPSALKTLFEYAEDNQADIIHMGMYYQPRTEDFHYGESVRVVPVKDLLFKDGMVRKTCEDVNDRLMTTFIKHGFICMVWQNLYRRDFLLDKNIWFKPIIHEDYLFTLACLTATDRIWEIPLGFYVYRQRKGSIMHNPDYPWPEAIAKAILVGQQYIQEVIPHLAQGDVPLDIDSLRVTHFEEMLSNALLFYHRTTKEHQLEIIQAIQNLLLEQAAKKNPSFDHKF